MDSGIHGHKLWFFGLFFGFQIGSWDLSGAAQLLGRRFRSRQGFRVVLRPGVAVFSVVGGDVHGCFHGASWLWHPMASHQEYHHLALFPGKCKPPSLSQHSHIDVLWNWNRRRKIIVILLIFWVGLFGFTGISYAFDFFFFFFGDTYISWCS